jgi:alkaline phosphatase D
MKSIFIVLFLFLSNCSYLGLISDLNTPTHDPKIEAQRNEETDLHPFPIIQGLTTEDQTEIKVLSKKNNVLIFKIFQNDVEIKTVKIESINAGETNYIIHRINIYELNKNTNYTLQVLKENTIVDQRNFQTVDLSLSNPKIGVVSCMHDKYKDVQFKMWNDYLNQNTTYTFMIGDNVYADSVLSSDGKVLHFKYASEATLWKRYVETFNTLSYYRSSRLNPTLAMWDDHDYGYNNGDDTYPYKKESLNIFESFFGFKPLVISKNKKANLAKPPVIEKLGGAGYVFNAFNQKFIFIDNRSFRSAPAKKNTKDETELGIDQTAKILSSIKPGMPTWLIKGDQFFGGYSNFESFENAHPNDFKNFLNELKKYQAKVFFVSGDRHLSELMRIESSTLGYETYELTSSGIHAAIFPNAWKKTPNPRKMEGASGVYNYSVVDSTFIPEQTKITGKNGIKKDGESNAGIWKLDVKSYGPKMKLLYSADLTIGDSVVNQ